MIGAILTQVGGNVKLKCSSDVFELGSQDSIYVKTFLYNQVLPFSCNHFNQVIPLSASFAHALIITRNNLYVYIPANKGPHLPQHHVGRGGYLNSHPAIVLTDSLLAPTLEKPSHGSSTQAQ
jgi:hypothetical protein